MSSRIHIDCLDNFGNFQKYSCYALHYDGELYQCALYLENLLKWNFTIMTEMNGLPDATDLNGLVFDSVFNAEKHAFAYLLPNRYRIATDKPPMPDLFSENDGKVDYYLFSNKGKRMFKCESTCHQHLLLLCSDKNFMLEDFEESLQNAKNLRMENLTPSLSGLNKEEQKNESGTKPKISKATKFIQHLFYDLELAREQQRVSEINRLLGAVTSIPDECYAFRPIVKPQLTIAPEYLNREDV